MARKLALINLGLLALLLAFGVHFIRAWQSFDEDHQPEELLRQVAKGRPVDPTAIPAGDAENRVGLPFDHELIADRNLFSEDRRPPQPDDPSGEEDAPCPLTRPPLLHGSAMIGESRVAYVTKYEGRSGRGARAEVHVGDRIEEHEISEISIDSMVLQCRGHETVIDKDTTQPERTPRSQVASGGAGVNIVRIGSPASAVETTTPTEATQERALVVSSAGGSAAPQRGGRGTRGQAQQVAGAEGANVAEQRRPTITPGAVTPTAGTRPPSS